MQGIFEFYFSFQVDLPNVCIPSLFSANDRVIFAV